MFKRRKPDEPGQSTTVPGPQLNQPAATEGLLDGASVGAKPTLNPTIPPARQPDTGFGVPPRPAAKEAPAMGRSPFPTPPAPPSPMPPPGMGSPPGGPGGSPGMAPGGAGLAAPRPGVQPPRNREPAERRTLVVGRGISVQGTVTDAERLVVEGTVEASMIHATELVIALGGVFKGEVEVEDTEIAGTIDGTLTARGNLIVRASGKVLGTARCRRLQVEDGGQITGRIEMITGPATDAPRSAAEPATTA